MNIQVLRVLFFCLHVWQRFAQGLKVALDPSDLVVVILSQHDPYHVAHAKLLQKDINHQAELMKRDPPDVIFTHELEIPGSWIFHPLFPHLSFNFPERKWFLFCLENTVIRLSELLGVLSKFNPNENIWISHGLIDEDITIIHHFFKHNQPLKYPSTASGFAIAKSFLQNFVNVPLNTRTDISIDPSHEFAFALLTQTKLPGLTHSRKFCIVSGPDCATYPRPFHPCNKAIPKEGVYVSVKTCKKFRQDRIPIILKTWSEYALNIGFYTDEKDETLPNFHIVPKTDSGHCAKTYGILKHAKKIMKGKGIDWLLIADDDTMLSLARIYKLLSCYNPKTLMAIGERYGFKTNKNGYDYLTAGSGLVLSAPLVELIVNSEVCKCPFPNVPDDMFLFGDCLKNLGVKLIHSPAFHQARPADYATAYLTSYEPVSFHTFWNIDPENVYKEWFAEDDEQFFKSQVHTEL